MADRDDIIDLGEYRRRRSETPPPATMCRACRALGIKPAPRLCCMAATAHDTDAPPSGEG